MSGHCGMGGTNLCRTFGAEVVKPWTTPCIWMFDCWEFLSQHSKECLKVGGVVSDGCHACLISPIHMNVDGGGEGTKLLIELVLKFFHEFGKMFSCDEWVGVGDIAHGLYLVRECFTYGCMCKSHHRLVGDCAIDTTTMHDEVHLTPEDVS